MCLLKNRISMALSINLTKSIEPRVAPWRENANRYEVWLYYWSRYKAGRLFKPCRKQGAEMDPQKKLSASLKCHLTLSFSEKGRFTLRFGKKAVSRWVTLRLYKLWLPCSFFFAIFSQYSRAFRFTTRWRGDVWRGTFVHRAEKAKLAEKNFGCPGPAEFFPSPGTSGKTAERTSGFFI